MWYRKAVIFWPLQQSPLGINPDTSRTLHNIVGYLQHEYVYKANYWIRWFDKYLKSHGSNVQNKRPRDWRHLNLHYQQKTVMQFEMRRSIFLWESQQTHHLPSLHLPIGMISESLMMSHSCISVSPVRVSERRGGYGPVFRERLMLPVGRAGKANGSTTPFRGTLGICGRKVQKYCVYLIIILEIKNRSDCRRLSPLYQTSHPSWQLEEEKTSLDTWLVQNIW